MERPLPTKMHLICGHGVEQCHGGPCSRIQAFKHAEDIRFVLHFSFSSLVQRLRNFDIRKNVEKKVKRNDLQVPIYGLSDIGLIHRFSDSIYNTTIENLKLFQNVKNNDRSFRNTDCQDFIVEKFVIIITVIIHIYCYETEIIIILPDRNRR